MRYAPRIPKTERDILLERLETEGLVRVQHKMVTATSYPEFVRHLYARETLPKPANHWAELAAKSAAKA